MDNKSKNCIFIRYKDGVKIYKLWNSIDKKVFYSRYVIFREVES